MPKKPNRENGIPNDFKFITRQGHTLSMHEIQAEYTVLLFHDPECNLCEQILTLLTKEPALSKAGVAVLAIYPDNDMELWQSKTYNMPKNWYDAYSPDGELIEHQIYFISSTPSIYLLDKDKRVVLKGTTPQELLKNLVN